MKRWYVVLYRYRGANYRFMAPGLIEVYARNATEAKQEAILQVGDMYTAYKVIPR